MAITGLQSPVLDVRVKMYDSLHMCAVLSKTVAHQVASILNTHHPQITVDIPEVQQQRGSNDCGLFAIAFATMIHS